MDIGKLSALAGAALLAVSTTASAGPMSVASAGAVAPAETLVQPVYYRHWTYHHGQFHRRYVHHWGHHYVHNWRHRYVHHWRGHRYYGWNPGAVIAGTALGLLSVPLWAADYGWCNSYLDGTCYGGYGWPYNYGYYSGPYYRHYGYWGGHRHYGYWGGGHRRFAGYGGGLRVGRSVGFGGGFHGGGFHGGGFHGGGFHGGGRR